MKANGIHPNGGPANDPPPNRSPAVPRKKKDAAKAAEAKRRKIEGDGPPSSARQGSMKMDDDEDAKPVKMEKVFQPKTEPDDVPAAMRVTSSQVKQETGPGLGMSSSIPFRQAHYALSNQPAVTMQHPQPQCAPIEDPHSLFEEFCNLPEVFPLEDAAARVEIKQDPGVPRYLPPLAGGLQSVSEEEVRQEPIVVDEVTGAKIEIEPILIAD